MYNCLIKGLDVLNNGSKNSLFIDTVSNGSYETLLFIKGNLVEPRSTVYGDALKHILQ